MPKLNPAVRLLLVGLAAAIAVVASTQDSLPIWAQAVVTGLSVILAGLGIVPPQISAHTVIDKERSSES